MPDIVLQEELTEIFFLFPEYIDEHRNASAPYIHDMGYTFEEQQPRFVDYIAKMLSFFSYETYVTKYYDKKNLGGMLYPYQELDYPNVCDTMRTTLRDYDVLDWRDELGEEDTVVEWHGVQVTNDTCAKVYERSLIKSREMLVHAILFAVEDAVESDGGVFVFKQNNVDCAMPYCSKQRELHAWLSDNRIPQRKYKYNPKHGENGINDQTKLPNRIPAALLECTGEYAQKLLCKAIGDVAIDNNLWYYDTEKQKIIYFEYQNESPQHEYHAYHLSPGEKRYDKVNIDLLRQIQDDIP